MPDSKHRAHQHTGGEVKIDTQEWLADIQVEAGGNLCRLLHKASGIDILRVPPSLESLVAEPEMYGVPVLFPPNRIASGMFHFKGRDYTFPLNEPERNNHLHGLVLGRPWRLKDVGRDYCVMEFAFTATRGFPHDLTLNMSYEFKTVEVVQQFSILNRSSLPMPIGLGFHTAFNLPTDAYATVSAGDYCWEIARPRCLPSGKLLPRTQEERIFRDDRAISLHCPMVTEMTDGQLLRGMVITYPTQHVKIYYEADEQYHHWCLWNGGGKRGFFCAEPMTWMVNAPNLDLPSDVSGMQTIAPGKSWRAQTSIRIGCYA